uniref:U21-Sparatoxin-Hju1z_1 n=1 Tax=Heteropoda jugulans TaxID=1358901 RepID=A0A4Q8K687_9ARAC
MNSKLCILLVIALCLTLVHAGGKYCPEPKRKGPCHMRYKDNQCCKQKRLSKPVHLLQNCRAATFA